MYHRGRVRVDRFDALAAVGVLALIVGLTLIHPALLLVAGGYFAVTNAAARMS